MIDTNAQLGAHAFIWVPEWTREHAHRAAAAVAEARLTTIEIPVLDPSLIDVRATVELLDRHRLRPTCSLALPGSAHGPAEPRAAMEFLRRAIDVTADLGSQWLTGVLYGQLGRMTGSGPTRDEIATIADILRHAADHARTRNVWLGIEVVNRYETYLLNTAQAALELLERVDRPDTVFAHLDTFHMHIEEPDIAGGVELLGDRLGYIHLAESNRGVIGSGTFAFGELFSALHRTGFAGPMVLEAFIHPPRDLMVATASWRPVAGDPANFVDASLAALRDLGLGIP